MAEIIRRALDGYLDDQADPEPALLPRSAQHLTYRSHRGTNGIVADFLVDNDVFMDHLRGAKRFEAKTHRIHYSVVTRAELFSGTTATELANVLLAPFREVDVNRSVAERAVGFVENSGSDCRMHSSRRRRSKTGSAFSQGTSPTSRIRGLRLREIG